MNKKYSKKVKSNLISFNFLIILLAAMMLLLSGCMPASTKESVPAAASENKNNLKMTAKSSDKKDNTSGNLVIHYIDVGQGDSIILQQGNSTMLIDAGTNASTNTLLGYLKKTGITRIDYLVLTHPHEDHIGGADAVIKSYDIGTIYMPKQTANTATFRDVVKAMNVKGLKAKVPVPSESFMLGGAQCTILGPVEPKQDDANTFSIVLKVTFGKNKFLFTGDTQSSNEEAMIQKGYDLSCDVLKVAHHGSKTSTCQDFLNKIKPKFAVISVGKDNDYHHPHEVTLKKLANMGVKLYRTDQCGNIICTSNGDKISFTFDINKSKK